MSVSLEVLDTFSEQLAKIWTKPETRREPKLKITGLLPKIDKTDSVFNLIILLKY